MLFTVSGLTTDIAYPDAMAVVSAFQAVGTLFLFGPASMNAAVAIDDVVISYCPEPSGNVPGGDVFYRVVFAFTGIRTMDDDFIDCSHGLTDEL